MANVKATMTDIKVIIREFYRGTSLREKERKLKLSRTSLRYYRSRAEAIFFLKVIPKLQLLQLVDY